MKFVGIIGIDGGGMDLNSRMTRSMSFSEAADWYTKSCEYFAMMAKYDPQIVEITVSVYDDRDLTSVTSEPISQSRFKG